VTSPHGQNDKGQNSMTTEPFSVLLGPSKFSKEGFLGTDARTPEEIMTADRETLAGLGLDNKKIAAALRGAYVAAERALGNPVEITPGVNAVHQEARGRIPSPFPEDGAFQKGEAVVSDKSSGVSFCITPLSIGLIEKHGFFQGKGSPYRIEPDIAARVLRLS
jgi:hypothetical protein